jgi:hypothetical protein
MFSSFRVAGFVSVLGTAIVLGPSIATAGGKPKATVGKVLEIPLFAATPDEGAIVLVAGPEIGATLLQVGDFTVVVPVAGSFVRAKRAFAVPQGTSVLEMTIGERMGGYDGRFFVTALFVPAGGIGIPYVAAAPVLVNFATVDEFVVPDQEDSPAATAPGAATASDGGGSRGRGVGRESKTGRGGDRRADGDGSRKSSHDRPAIRPASQAGSTRRLR